MAELADNQLCFEEFAEKADAVADEFRKMAESIKDFAKTVQNVSDLAEHLKKSYGICGGSGADEIKFKHFDSHGCDFYMKNGKKYHYSWHEAAKKVKKCLN